MGKKILLAYLISFISILNSCRNLEEISFIEIEVGDSSKVTATSFEITANIVGLASEELLTEHGFVYSNSNPLPTLIDKSEALGLRSDNGEFSTSIKDLTINQKYYVRAFVSSQLGTVYSKNVIEVVLEPIELVFSGVSVEKDLAKVVLRDTVTGLAALGRVNAFGHTWSKINKEPILGQDNASIFNAFEPTTIEIETTIDIRGLSVLDTYYVRSYLVVGERTFYSEKTTKFVKGDVWDREIATNLKPIVQFHFTIEDEIYIYYHSDQGGFGKYDLDNNRWIPLKKFPFDKQISRPVTFVINNKGYIGTGRISFDYKNLTTLFWEFDPSKGTMGEWSPKANFIGTAREDAVGFSIGDKGYIGYGNKNDPFEVLPDFYEYDPKLDKWENTRFNYPGEQGKLPVSFDLVDRGCVGLVFQGTRSDCYCFKPKIGWTRAADFPFTISNIETFSFSSRAQSGFLILPTPKDNFWEYDAITDQWIKRSDYLGGVRSSTIGFFINEKGYFGLGRDFFNNGTLYTDLREYIPETKN